MKPVQKMSQRNQVTCTCLRWHEVAIQFSSPEFSDTGIMPQFAGCQRVAYASDLWKWVLLPETLLLPGLS